jgi:hypothetical protein
MRVASASMIAALQARTLHPALFVQATFLNGPVYVWSGAGTLSWNGQTWQGVGTLGSVSTIEEGTTVEAKGITISLSGIDNTLLTDVLGNYRLGLPVTVWLGLFDDAHNLIPDPIISFAGRMDQPTLTVGAETSTLSINCESRLLDMNVPCNRRFTQDDQQIDYPGDRGFEFVNAIQDVTIYWGRYPGSQENWTVQGYSGG